MKILFIMMTPLQSNTSAIMRMTGIIRGAAMNGHICDLITLWGNENDSHYDSFNADLEEKCIHNYYRIPMKRLYSVLKASKKDTKSKNKIINLKQVVRNCGLWFLKNFTVYEGTDINAKRILEIDIDFDSYDRIVSVSDPKSSHKMVLELLKAGRLTKIRDKWIQCWGDPWVSDMTRHFGAKKPLIQREEAGILDLARKIVYTSPFTLAGQKRLYKKSASKMFLVNQTVLETYGSVNIERKHKSIGYFGAYMNSIRNILPLYECCKSCNYSLIIAGKTDLHLPDTDTIRICQKLPFSTVSKLERQCGVIVCLCNRSGTQIPGKVYYQAAMQKPVIIIVDGENREKMRTYFESFHRYIICDNNKDAIKHAIEQAYADIDSDKHYDLDKRYYPDFCAKKILS